MTMTTSRQHSTCSERASVWKSKSLRYNTPLSWCSRMKEEEDDIMKQLHTLDERLAQWRERAAL